MPLKRKSKQNIMNDENGAGVQLLKFEITLKLCFKKKWMKNVVILGNLRKCSQRDQNLIQIFNSFFDSPYESEKNAKLH